MTRGRAGKQVLRVAEMTMTQFARARRKKRTVIIPLGSTEEHGPHLPLDTDTIIAREIARRAAEDTGRSSPRRSRTGSVRARPSIPGRWGSRRIRSGRWSGT